MIKKRKSNENGSLVTLCNFREEKLTAIKRERNWNIASKVTINLYNETKYINNKFWPSDECYRVAVGCANLIDVRDLLRTLFHPPSHPKLLLLFAVLVSLGRSTTSLLTTIKHIPTIVVTRCPIATDNDNKFSRCSRAKLYWRHTA